MINQILPGSYWFTIPYLSTKIQSKEAIKSEGQYSWYYCSCWGCDWSFPPNQNGVASGGRPVRSQCIGYRSGTWSLSRIVYVGADVEGGIVEDLFLKHLLCLLLCHLSLHEVEGRVGLLHLDWPRLSLLLVEYWAQVSVLSVVFAAVHLCSPLLLLKYYDSRWL